MLNKIESRSVVEMIELPFDILFCIASVSLESWRAMLAVPEFGRWTLCESSRETARRIFSEEKKESGEWMSLFRGTEHSFFDHPSRTVAGGDGKMIYARWTRKGKIHRGRVYPAEIEVIGPKTKICWYSNGKYCSNRPARIYISTDPRRQIQSLFRAESFSLGEISSVEWWSGGRYPHRKDGPAKIYYSAGKITSQSWYRCGKLHSYDDRPAFEEFRGDSLARQHWYRDGLLHRDGDLPAVINIFPPGARKIKEKIWYWGGFPFRGDGGPLFVDEFADGRVTSSWYLDGRIIQEEMICPQK